MNIYAIADLHLSLSDPDKNMDVFGAHWKGYMDKIRDNWIDICKEDDVIIIPGDISWAMNFSEMEKDFEFINDLPGIKLILKGNHDFWWSTAAKREEIKRIYGLQNIFFIHNNCYLAGNTVVCGTRGWLLPEDRKFTQKDVIIYERELARLKLSLDSAESHGEREIVAAFHFPPFTPDSQNESEFIRILKEYNVRKCIFGHIHNINKNFHRWKDAIDKLNMAGNIEFKLVSADFLFFKPNLLMSL